MTTTTTKVRPLHTIASEIRKDWANKVNYGAVPYLKAMMYLETVNDVYYDDNAKSVVRYFLANAGTWRGEVAKRVKVELNLMVK